MDHNFALENHTAERYLMGELTEPERDAYEEHFFCCTACAEEIKSASAFMETARQVIQDDLKNEVYGHAARHSIWGSWLNWRSMLQPFPAMACALLVLVSAFTIYQNRVTLPRLSQAASPQLAVSDPVVLRSARSVVPVLTIRQDKPFVLHFDVPPAQCSSYEVSVVTVTNLQKFSLKNITAQEAKQTLDTIVPAGTLGAGRYFLVIQGVNGESKGEIDRIPFDIKLQD